jgi:type I restriction enzyme M protein
MTGEELMDFVNNQLLPEIKTLQAPLASNPRGFVVREGLSEAFNYMKNGTLLRQVINKLNDIDFTNSEERHLFGDIYEQLLRDLQAAGGSGEFYTPRAVTRFAVQMIEPKLGESIYDPACGTGGFLACSIDLLKTQIKTAEDQKVFQTAVSGIEKKQLPHLLCTTNMMLHGIEVPQQIRQGNTLKRPLSSIEASEMVDVIVTNPPFGGSEEDGIEKNFPTELQTKETADLFLQYILEMLKDRGRAAVVLPDGTLFGDGVKTKIKKLLLDECNLHTLIRLPKSVFAPYTDIKTNILFFEKGTPTKDIWYYEVPLPNGVKAFNKTKPMKSDDFSVCLNWWGEGSSITEKIARSGRQETNQAWKVSIEEIIERDYDLDIKNPYVAEVITYDPEELLSSYADQQADIQNLRDQLKSILASALASKS